MGVISTSDFFITISRERGSVGQLLAWLEEVMNRLSVNLTTTVRARFFFFFQAEDGIRDLTVTGVQTCALPILGEIAHQQGNLIQAETIFQEGLGIARELRNREQISALLHELGWIKQKQGNLTEAETYLQEGLTLAHQIEDKERICSILKVLGLVAIHRGDFTQAEVYLREGLSLAQQIQDNEQACLLLI